MTLGATLKLTLAAGVVLAAGPWVLSDFMLSLTLTCLMYAGLAVS